MKKKYLIILAVLCAALFVLTACGNTGGSENAGGSGNAGNSETTKGADGGNSGTESVAEVYDVGAFTVAIPSGWKAFPADDYMAGQDENGNYPPDPKQIIISKAKDQYNALLGPTVQIFCTEPDEYIGDLRNWYTDVEDIEGVMIGGVACDAFSGNSMGMGDIRQEILYVTDDAKYEIIILTSVDGKDTGISWEDADVKMIMESLKKK